MEKVSEEIENSTNAKRRYDWGSENDGKTGNDEKRANATEIIEKRIWRATWSRNRVIRRITGNSFRVGKRRDPLGTIEIQSLFS